jgi:ABC-type Fe3+-hydroxamate transport system substrate-binding protein
MKRPGKAAVLLALLIVLILVFADCGGRQAQQQRANVEPRPQRIVSLSPSVTEILYGIGAWPQVIAV